MLLPHMLTVGNKTSRVYSWKRIFFPVINWWEHALLSSLCWENDRFNADSWEHDVLSCLKFGNFYFFMLLNGGNMHVSLVYS